LYGFGFGFRLYAATREIDVLMGENMPFQRKIKCRHGQLFQNVVGCMLLVQRYPRFSLQAQ